MKNLAIVLLIVAAFFGGYYFSQKYNFKLEPKTKDQVMISPTTEMIVGNDVDAHGCKGSAGYSWCEIKQKCLRVFEEKCEEEDLKTIIKQLLVEKHGNSANSLTITVSKKTDIYAKGGASAEGGGAMWLATKENGQWVIVFEGNGAPDCQSIKTNYKFPVDMLVNVCD